MTTGYRLLWSRVRILNLRRQKWWWEQRARWPRRALTPTWRLPSSGKKLRWKYEYDGFSSHLVSILFIFHQDYRHKIFTNNCSVRVSFPYIWQFSWQTVDDTTIKSTLHAKTKLFRGRNKLSLKLIFCCYFSTLFVFFLNFFQCTLWWWSSLIKRMINRCQIINEIQI